MMGVLIDIGKGEMSIDELRDSLINFNENPMMNNAPSSGLLLHQVDYHTK